ncbi:MAG: hypothetical protein MZV63_06195 [Marinilabiliales bacterium]|nr:hypothetical protein [Marinilabiliales bacterium]
MLTRTLGTIVIFVRAAPRSRRARRLARDLVWRLLPLTLRRDAANRDPRLGHAALRKHGLRVFKRHDGLARSGRTPPPTRSPSPARHWRSCFRSGLAMATGMRVSRAVGAGGSIAAGPSRSPPSRLGVAITGTFGLLFLALRAHDRQLVRRPRFGRYCARHPAARRRSQCFKVRTGAR